MKKISNNAEMSNKKLMIVASIAIALIVVIVLYVQFKVF